jgi:hypothetical protein
MTKIKRDRIGPVLFNRVRYGAVVRATVVLDGGRPALAVAHATQPNEYERHLLRFAEEIPEGLVGSTGGFALRNNAYVFLTAAELDAETATAESLRSGQREETAKREAARLRLIEENRAFNARLAIPVAWIPAYKIVLSGLLGGGSQDGIRRNSVAHVQLREPLRVGPIKRDVGDLLCTRDRGRFGTTADGAYGSGDGDPDRRVNCATCLRIAMRLAERARVYNGTPPQTLENPQRATQRTDAERRVVLLERLPSLEPVRH